MTKPLIAIMGRSGQGKSTSIRNLDPKKTLVLITENKPLPFRNSKIFKPVYVTEPMQLFAYLEAVNAREAYEAVVVDSFTGWSEQLAVRAYSEYKNFDIQNFYNENVAKLFKILKSMNKYTFLTCHDDQIDTVGGGKVVSGRVKFKANNGIIEESATVMAYCKTVDDPKGGTKHVFDFKSNPYNPSKAPMDLLKAEITPNDMRIILDSLKEFYAE